MTTAPIKDTTSLSDPIQFDRQRTDCTIENLEALVAGESGVKDAYANLTAEEKLLRQEELSFYSSSTNDHGDDNIWGLLSGVGGNIYEW